MFGELADKVRNTIWVDVKPANVAEIMDSQI